MRYLILLAVLSVFSSCMFRQSVPLIVHHAQIYTVDEKFSVVEAMAVKDGKVLETGTNDEILKKYKGSEEINAGGKAIFPGFIDAHCHFAGYATDKWKCTVTGTKSWQEVLEKIKKYSENAPMEWIYGRGWDQNDWDVKEYPEKSVLDSLFPNRPVYLKRVDGHAAIANQKALDISGISASTKLAGGEVEVKNGKPTGILIDNAMGLVEAKIPRIADSLAIKYYGMLQEECFGFGLTGVHDCGMSEHTVDLLEQAQKNGSLKMKIFALLEDNPATYDKWLKKGRYTNGNITVGGYKFYADGALGSRGACMIKDYSDRPGWKGFLLSDEKHFRDIALRMAGTNLQMCTHAIGDSGNRTLLKIYAEALKGKNDKRWRIEHAQIVDSSDFDYFGKYSVIPSVQPTHATSDMYWAKDRVGPVRIKFAYAYKKLLQQMGWIALGTDFPVEDINPFKTFLAAVARQDAQGFPAGGFEKDNALSREETIRGMTIWAAKSVFEEKQKGSLEKGKAADFIMLDKDLMKIPVEDILKTKVLATYVDGAKVFGK